ncbi:helix-turn-helix domain-containing protein [Arthrobacter nitrophenolicus]|uniref:helix-turn-helix domain-containing protein n=1 Tax=Arthrobacter nitrophenolicus TaxID=683150 RepID=UPI003B8A863A
MHAGPGVCAIAKELGRSPSTVSREICRNTHMPSGSYRPRAADREIAANPVLREFIKEQLEQRWSPRQIGNRLRAEYCTGEEAWIWPGIRRSRSGSD